MYQSSAAPRAPNDEEERMAREARNGNHPHQHPPSHLQQQQQQHPPPPPPMQQQPLPSAYQSRSPSMGHASTAYHSYSPPNGSHPPPPQPPAYAYSSSSRPSSSAAMAPPPVDHSPRLTRPASPSHAAMPGLNRSPYKSVEPPKPTSTFYDPTSEHREQREASWTQSPYTNRSPQLHERTPYDTPSHDRRATPRSPTTAHYPALSSPTYASRAPRPPPQHEPSSPPRAARNQSSIAHLMNGSVSESNAADRSAELRSAPVEEPKTVRADPMAFSSILSAPSAEQAPPPPSAQPTARPATPPPPAPPTSKPRSVSKVTNGDATPVVSTPATQPPPPPPPPSTTTKKPRKSAAAREDGTPREHKDGHKARSIKATGQAKKLNTNAVEEAIRTIEALREIDLDVPNLAGLKRSWDAHIDMCEKKVKDDEVIARKKRRTYTASRTALRIDKSVLAARESFRNKYEESVIGEVQQQEVMDEKERKKDMQRKRRREKTIHTETEKLRAIRERFEQTTDEREREKLIKDHQKSQKKVNTTKRILDNNGALTEDLDEVMEPLPIGLDGPLGSINGASPEPTRRRGKGTGRLKKSKEQKQAEKDKAYNAAMESSPVSIAPKEEKRRETVSKDDVKPGKRRRVDKKAAEEEAIPAPPQTTYTSKGYNQIYEQIWKDIARKDIPKVYRIKETSLTTKQANLRKTAQLASKEARRWQLRTNKSTKDTQARAKRCMREMMTFWKRNEREERDLRRVAERQELENAKKAEAEREANRQRRKLEFLINQTELYSHFIGKKVKTDEVERSTDSKDVGVSQETVQPGRPDATVVNLPSEDAKVSAKVTNFEDLDFDAEDESQLHEAAMANAQHAVQEAQSKARAFNEGGEATMAQFDDGEMNFQNPTGLGETDIEQPKMLTCQLKEYQLKGLNWLVNLYEQGINGILADEMGLGKTVQSISVMAYLAEKHNIWGPFLVIAPASTLHNWQQEVSRFVPNLKVVPYWGSARDRKVLRKFWDRKHITYTKDSEFHCLITSYQLVVQDAQYFQKMRWQYMILDEAQAIKSSSSSRWKNLLGFHCRNRLLLTGTPIQNNMQELWALLHFIMPTLFDSHDEFSDWFSRDIENHAQSNTKLNEDQLKRLHMILKPFMLRRVKKHVQKELGDKVEKDVFCDLTYRQRALYSNLRNKISILDLIEKAAMGDEQDTSTLMNLVMQFRKVCNHPDLFERAEIRSPLALAHFAETASFVREGHKVNVGYSTRNLIEYDLPRLICSPEGRLDQPGPTNAKAGFRHRYLDELMNIWTPEHMHRNSERDEAFTWLRFVETNASEASKMARRDPFERAAHQKQSVLGRLSAIYDEQEDNHYTPTSSMLSIVDRNQRLPLAEVTETGYMKNLMNVSRESFAETGLRVIEQCARPAADAPPIEISCSNQSSQMERSHVMFNEKVRAALYGLSRKDEQILLDSHLNPADYPPHNLLPRPISDKARYTNIEVPSMRRFVTDSGKLNKLDQLLRQLKEEGHRVLLYFQMTRMIDLMEEYLTYRNYKYLRLDGSTKLEDRRDTVHDFQTRPEIFIFLLSTRAGGLGINLTSADTVIFYDSDWNPTIDSQAMDRAHRLGQTKQVTVYRLITRGTIEERIRKRALQKEEVQRVVISGGSGVDFNTRSKDNKTKDMAMWLVDDDQAEMIEQKSKELEERQNDPAFKGRRKKVSAPRKKDISMDDMYHEGEGHFDDGSAKPSATGTPMDSDSNATATKRGPRGGRGLSKKAKTAKQRLAMADGGTDMA